MMLKNSSVIGMGTCDNCQARVNIRKGTDEKGETTQELSCKFCGFVKRRDCDVHNRTGMWRIIQNTFLPKEESLEGDL